MEDRMKVRNAAQFGADLARVAIRDLPPAARFSLRVGPADRAAVAEAIGVALPEKIGARAVAGARSALCLGPDEWLVAADEGEAAGLAASFAAVAARLAASAVEVSDREITYRLEGPAVVDLLATGCPLDLARMPVGHGTRTVFDTVQVVLTREAEDRFHLTVWRSFAPHVRALLDIAARELAAGL
jgi:sarcosine oxidase subunit gamma